MRRKKKKTSRIAGSNDTRIGFGYPRRPAGKKPHRILGGGGPRRESYRTEREAIKARDRWRKIGHSARIAERHPKIRKFVVEVSRERKRKR